MQLYHAIKYLYPHAKPGIDFVLRDDADGRGPYIEHWNLPNPRPTEDELLAAWEAYQANPPAPEPSEIEILGQALVEKEIEVLTLGQALAELELQVLELKAGGGAP